MPINLEDISDQEEQEELSYWLAFEKLSLTGLGLSKLKLLVERFDSLKGAWNAPSHELKRAPGLNEQLANQILIQRGNLNPAALLSQLEADHIKGFHYYHRSYPARLREIYDPPTILYMKGNFRLQDPYHVVGIVGTRRPSAYGQRLAKEMAKDLASCGVTIVSGMALGVDSLAHWGAIEAKGRTCAVLGCGVDICYPSSNKPLYKSLIQAENQAVLSEYVAGTKPDTWRFPARNRIIAGLCEALLVIEAGETSGALITAEIAFNANREVFAVPGRVDSPMSMGTNGLVARTKAHLCRNYMDIMNDMDWVSSSTKNGEKLPEIVQLYGREREIFELISSEPVHFDYLLEKTGMNTGELSASLTMLELAGVVARLPGDWYVRETQRATV